MKSIQKIAIASSLVIGILSPSLVAAEEFSKELIDKGRYLATASDCVACHTNHNGGKPMAGGLPMSSPVGTIMSTNITPSKQFGIGNYTEEQFADAVRKGIRADGANLYPAMPYVSYSIMTDEDIHALYAYFMQGVEPVDEKAPETALPFPMNIRASMMGWNMLFRPADKPLADDPQQSAEWNRGRYLAEGAAHCSTCHTPRGTFMQEKKDLNLSGGQVGAWYAPDITSDPVHGIGSWSQADLVTYLKTGKLDHRAQAAGSMAEAISYSFQHLTDADLNAVATYIRSVPSANTNASLGSRFDKGTATNDLAGFRGKPYADGLKGDHAGAQLYISNCASCHGYNASGTKDGYYPSLFHNAATAGDNAVNLIAAILYGVDRHTEAGHVFMPSFGDQPNAVNALTNVEVASLSNYILSAYGNDKLSVSADDVQVVRNGGPSSNLVTLARIGLGAGGTVALLIVIGVFVWMSRRGRRISA